MSDERQPTLEELLELEGSLAGRLTELSKNAHKNKPKIERVMEQMGDVSRRIDEHGSIQQSAREAAMQPKINELREKQDGILSEIGQLSKQPSRYSERIAELGRQAREIDSQIEAVKNGGTS